MSRSVPLGVLVHYPCSDDQPMAESEFQLVPTLYFIPPRSEGRRRQRNCVP